MLVFTVIKNALEVIWLPVLLETKFLIPPLPTTIYNIKPVSWDGKKAAIYNCYTKVVDLRIIFSYYLCVPFSVH